VIDVHTHILPGIDDGAADWDDTLRMARAAAAEGITRLVATPHHANGRYHNLSLSVRELVREANERLAEAGLSLAVLAGQEIRVHDDLLEAWNREELLTLAGSDYVLIEMPSSIVPKDMYELVHELSVLNLKPVIAHPERNKEVAEHPERLVELIGAGAYAQVTTHSLLGGFGRGIQRTAWALCRNGLIHLVSSDAHHAERRGFRLREAYDAVSRRMGTEWTDYFQDNARRVADNRAFGRMPAGERSPDGLLRRIVSYFRGK